MRTAARAAFAGVLLGLLLAILTPASPASAHAVLKSSDPAADAIVPEAPATVSLVFTEPVQLVAGRIQVLAPDGSRADQGEPSVAGTTVTIRLRGEAQGTYLVSYRVISADSHPIAGAFPYSVGVASTPPVAADDTSAGVDPVVRTAIAVAKYLGYAGLLLIIGPVMVLSLLWPHRLQRRAPGRLVWTGFGLTLASALAALWLQVPYTTGTGLFGGGWSDLQGVLGSTFGAVMLVRIGVVCAAALLVRPLIAGTGGESRSDLAVLTVLGVAAVSTWPLTGHPSASPVAAVSIVIDAVHLAAMAVWLGGLVMLFGFLLPRADERELGAILPIWSRWATVAVGALVLAGTTQALIEVGTLDGLVSTTYGRLMMVKVGLVALVLAVAAYSRRLVQRAAAGGVTRPVRRAVAVELGATAVILAVTAVLVQTPPARTAAAGPAGGQAVTTSYDATLTNESFRLQVTAFPATVGNNSIHLYAYNPDGTPLPVVEWVATAALPAQNVEPIAVDLLRITDNHAIGEVSLPTAGDWELRFTLRTSEIEQSTVAGTVPIR
ncbi:copper resistance CopC/CopD family protein [Spirilliplanes yamanashiensis]|uniref:Copper transport protein n=1 Tax=Spirilliplanes yamanashiensis TaxID=42233 RepID=A0A8J3YF89_9ACTN|nr:copper resistance protein CopC [Spirilliplanes yamanashiensis]MDP9818381.1 copper transport protein [Spirilliplanes yamanashiensis]GIJ06602.1 hypothetical protein Sya03_59540 [Spirilliplanes yamanashiensis]